MMNKEKAHDSQIVRAKEMFAYLKTWLPFPISFWKDQDSVHVLPQDTVKIYCGLDAD